MEPTYYDGDIVYVQKATHLDVGDVGIFQKDNCIYIKETLPSTFPRQMTSPPVVLW